MTEKMTEPENRLTLKNPAAVFVAFAIIASIFLLLSGGCTIDEPDTSAPERTVIDRTRDWQGALLYITDASGPEPGWGSVRIYDNVSGFVEKTVEQTAAANPADVYVTPDESSMYVAGAENGRVDKFRWDGNNWIDGGVTIETPATMITSMARGPEGKLYMTTNDGGTSGRIYRIDISTDTVDGLPLNFPEITNLRGIAWSPDGATVYLSGIGPQGQPRLASAAWPSLTIKNVVDFPDTTRANRVLSSADGRRLYVLASGKVYKVDPATMALSGQLTPAPSPNTEYAAGAFSADGRYLFVAGKTTGEDSSLYVVDLTSDAVVKTVKHISDTASGMQRVE